MRASIAALVRSHGFSYIEDIGYREIAEALARGAAPATVQSDIIVSTRQYAKRQLTWFNREPTLQKVMLSGTELPSLDVPFLS